MGGTSGREERPAPAVDSPTDLVFDSVSEFSKQGTSPSWSSPSSELCEELRMKTETQNT